MNRTFYLSRIEAGTTLRLRIVGTVNNRYIAVCIFLASGAGNKVRVHQADLIAREETEVFLRRFFHKVLAFDVKFSAEWNLSGTKFLILHIVRCIQLLDLSFRIVVNDKLDRVKNCHHTGLL